jgi:hypothetical protein
MLLNELLSELRREPAKNVVLDTASQIEKYYNQYGDDLYVNFGDFIKVGVNPQSGWYTDPSKNESPTPVGIYAYPIRFVYDKIKNTRDTQNLPYAGDKKYMHFLRPRIKPLELGEIDQKMLQDYVDRARRIFGEQEANSAFNAATTDDKRRLAPGHQFWYFTQFLADKILPLRKIFRRKINNTSSAIAHPMAITWNKVLRQLVDRPIEDYNEWIYISEPEQILFLDVSDFEVIDTVENRSPSMRSRKMDPASWKKFKQDFANAPDKIQFFKDQDEKQYLRFTLDSAQRKYISSLMPDPAERANFYSRTNFLHQGYLDFDVKVIENLILSDAFRNIAGLYRAHPSLIIRAIRNILDRPVNIQIKSVLLDLVDRGIAIPEQARRDIISRFR